MLLFRPCDSAKCDLPVRVFPCGHFFFPEKKYNFLTILSKLNRTSHKRTRIKKNHQYVFFYLYILLFYRGGLRTLFHLLVTL